MASSNTKKRALLITAVSIFCACTVALVSLTNIALARSMDNAILAKAYYAALLKCYEGGYMTKDVNVLDFVYWAGGNGIIANSKKDIPMPDTLATTPASCKDIFESLFSMGGVTPPSTLDTPAKRTQNSKQTADFLKKVGYVETSSNQSVSGGCIGAKYYSGADINNTETKDSPLLCADNIDANGKIQVDKMTVKGSENFIKIDTSAKHKVKIHCGYQDRAQRRTTVKNWNPAKELAFTLGGSWDDFKSQFNALLSTGCQSITVTKKRGSTDEKTIYTYAGPIDESTSTVDAIYSNKGKTSAELAYKNLIGASSPGSKFTEQEMIALYYTYLWDVYGIDPKDTNQFMCDPTADQASKMQAVGGWLQFKVFAEGKMNSNCWIKISESNPKKVNGLTSGRIFSQPVGIKEIRAALNGAGASSMPDDYDWGKVEVSDPTEPGGSTVAKEPTNLDHCMQVAGAMGWIMCPALSAIESILESLYDDVIEPLLQVNPKFIDRSNGTYTVWVNFRDIANLVFVIVILLIIFSQVTGYGIDNYGIKRMLPKLIIAAILVNFSFIICQLAVDVSNILGAGLNGFFQSIGAVASITINGETVNLSPGGGFWGGLFRVFTFFIEAVAVGVITFSVLSGPGIIMSLLVSFLGALAAVLFMFLSLGIRMVGVVILTVLAPVAFVAYILPNTNSLFKKWLDTFKAMLLLYPICGLLVGGGQFACTIILNAIAGGTDPNLARFFYTIIAMFVSVAPFFALPALLRKSISALGSIGGALQGFQSRLQGRIAGIRGTEGYRRAVVGMNSNKFSLGLRSRVAGYASNVGEGRGRFGRLITAPIRAAGRAGSRGANATAALDDRYANEDSAAAASLQDRIDPKTFEQLADDFRTAKDSNDSNAMAVALRRIENMGRAKDGAALVAEAAGELKISNGDQAELDKLEAIRNAIDKQGETNKMLAAKEGDVSRMLSNRGRLENGALGDLSAHSAAFAAGADAKDYVGSSTQAQLRMARSGQLNGNVINELANSSDPSIRTAIDGDETKSNILGALAAGTSTANFHGDNWKNQVAQVADEYRAQNTLNVQQARQQEINELGEAIGRGIRNNNPPTP